MIDEDGDPVFFEGNMAVYRLAHYITLRPAIPPVLVAALQPFLKSQASLSKREHH